METSPRSARSQADDDMPPSTASAYKPPPEKDKISARISALTKKKLQVITTYWRTQRRLDKAAEVASMKLTPAEKQAIVEDAVKDVDLTYIIDSLLERVADSELMQWGGYPETQEAIDAQVRLIEKHSK